MQVAEKKTLRFGPFEIDLRSGEVSNNGLKLKLQRQPVKVLEILLEKPGELITREEFRERLWPADTFVDFEHSLNTDIKKLRQALGDEAETPRYIETLPRRGYRFIAQVETVLNGVDPIAWSVKAPLEMPDGPDNSRQGPPKPRRWRLVVIMLVMAIAVGVWYRFHLPRTPVVTAIHQLTRTGHARFAYHGVRPVATDGTRIYFNEHWEGKPRIAQMSAQGGEVSYLDLSVIQEPWLVDSSADGSQLLVFDFSAAVVNDRLWLVSLPNGPQRRIENVTAYNASLTPDARHVLYTQSPNFKQLFTADVETGQAGPLFATPTNIGTLSVSPDGSKTRFNTGDGIWEALLDGSGSHRFLPQHRAHICCGAWSPDGKIYAFASEDNDGSRVSHGWANSYNLWAVTESGPSVHPQISGPVQLTNGPISFTYPRFSRDGKQIFVFGQTRLGELSVYDAANGQIRPYLNGISSGFVDFSRDGQWITYVSYPQNTLWRSRLNGSERLQLTFPPMGGALNPKWSPDGRLIAFMEWGVGGKERIYIVPADGGSPMLLLSDDFNPSDPTWSPDGKSIAYGGAAIGPLTEIRILDLARKRSRTIPNSQHMFSPRWSPDGRYIAALSDDLKSVFLYSFDAARWKELLLPMRGSVEWPTWSHDSRYLYVSWNGRTYRFQVPDGRAELAVDTSPVDRACPIFAGNCGWFGLTPDDRVMVLRDRGFDELYALDLEYR